MNDITQFLPFIIPLVIIELALAVTALIHVLRHNTYKFGSRAMWILIVLFVQIIGPIFYFVFGRSDSEE